MLLLQNLFIPSNCLQRSARSSFGMQWDLINKSIARYSVVHSFGRSGRSPDSGRNSAQDAAGQSD